MDVAGEMNSVGSLNGASALGREAPAAAGGHEMAKEAAQATSAQELVQESAKGAPAAVPAAASEAEKE